LRLIERARYRNQKGCDHMYLGIRPKKVRPSLLNLGKRFATRTRILISLAQKVRCDQFRPLMRCRLQNRVLPILWRPQLLSQELLDSLGRVPDSGFRTFVLHVALLRARPHTMSKSVRPARPLDVLPRDPLARSGANPLSNHSRATRRSATTGDCDHEIDHFALGTCYVVT